MLLRLEHICKEYPGVVALDDVSFDLRQGEVHVLLGENGAGKSTLVKILSGACRKTSGRLFLDDREVEIRSPRHAMDLGIGVIYQELNLVPELTVAENFFLGREPRVPGGIIRIREMERDARRLMDAFGVCLPLSEPVGSLSMARMQLVEILKALSLDARILIMDEPTSALTDVEIAELFRMIRSLKARGVSFIFISHRMDELFEIGDRVTVLRDGKMAGSMAIADTSRSRLIHAMVDRDLDEQFPRDPVEPGVEVLRVEKLSRKDVLEDISFSLRKGEILGIAGLMGSGRTDLARALFGADQISAGEIHIHGKKRRISSPAKAIAAGLALLTEDRKHQGLVLELPVKDNIALPSLSRLARFGIVDAAAESQSAESLKEDLAIKTPSIERKTLFLSGGNQQKVVLAKWLCRRADVFIFDEPTRGIDVGAKLEIYRIMNRLTARGCAIIMISSELPEILGMSDRILVMRQGRIVDEMARKDARQERILSSALGVKHEA